jgi:hypothetical protein
MPAVDAVHVLVGLLQLAADLICVQLSAEALHRRVLLVAAALLLLLLQLVVVLLHLLLVL